jgi:hypothetical protein
MRGLVPLADLVPLILTLSWNIITNVKNRMPVALNRISEVCIK